MKKIFCLMLCLILMMSASSCGSNAQTPTDVDTTQPRTTVTAVESVTDLAPLGKFDTTDVKLGDIIDKIEDAYEYAPDTTLAGEDEHGHSHDVYLEKTIGTNLTRFTYADLQFFTVNGKDNEGVAIMVTSSGAYGFKCNINLKEDITNVLGNPDYEMALPDAERFYMLGQEDAYRMTYMYDNYRLDFITVEDILAFIVLTDTDIYDEFSTTAHASTETVTVSVD